ncbi:MAG: YihY/virulence factor BrkB family protein [Crocinitomicaceae bacterium]|nr:YihY/virulence factor BrkB family protein [Crocinitomicaceae bacterium]MDG2505317.1 YihY/virulence factor BrkB family protein [Crocinitomicaceae bacterium]
MKKKNYIQDLSFYKYTKGWLQKKQLPRYTGFSFYDLLKMYFYGLVKGDLTSRAGSISYSFFMAIFPALLFVLNLIPYIPIANFTETFSGFIESAMPASSQEFFMSIYTDIQTNQHGGLLSSSFLLSIFFMGNGVSSIFAGFQGSYHIKNSRSFLRQYVYSVVVGLVLSLLLLLVAAVYIFFLIYLRNAYSRIEILDLSFWISGFKLVFTMFSALLFSATLYFTGTPGGRKERFFTPGSLMTALLFLLTTYFFGIYIAKFSNYNQLYGSIGALLVMMLYIYINAILLLLGFELNAALAQLKKN